MLWLTTHLWILLQPAPTSTASESASGATQALGGCSGSVANFAPILLMVVVMYFLVLRPQQKQQRAHNEMLKALKKGMVVRTNGGIRGEVVEVQEKDVVLWIADKVRVTVLRSHIASVETGKEPATSTKTHDSSSKST